MIRRIRECFKHEEGFTLIELLVVIAVLGVLASIAIPKFSGVTDKAAIAEEKSLLRNAQSGLEMFYATKGKYPENLDDINEFVEIEGLRGANYNPSGSSYYDLTLSGGSIIATPGGMK